MKIERLHWKTDAPLSAAQSQALSQRFARGLAQALPRGGRGLRIGTLTVQLPQQALRDPAALTRIAAHTARQITASTKQGGG